MKKLVQGIVNFRRNMRPGYRETFARLALGQSPDVLFIGCSDSRVAVNVFASTDPGDLFVVRNVGNLVAPCGSEGHSTGDESEFAAIEFALQTLNVTSIIVCGHSECGAMQALHGGRDRVTMPHLRSWLRHGEPALERCKTAQKDRPLLEWPSAPTDVPTAKVPSLAQHNLLSLHNVLTQLEHLKTYPLVQERLAQNKLTLHGWWFELSRADVYAYEEEIQRFLLIDDTEAQRILKQLLV